MKPIINPGKETLFKLYKPIRYELLVQHQTERNQIKKNKY